MTKRQCGRWGWDIRWSLRFALYVGSMVCLWSIVGAQSAAAPPTALPPCEGCSRELVSTVWGFILTLVALTLDDWGNTKNMSEDLAAKILAAIFVGSVNPVMGLFARMSNLVDSWEMRKRMSTQESAGEDRSEMIRILSGCVVVASLSPIAHEEFNKLDTSMFRISEGEDEDLSDALVIGEVDRGGSQVELTSLGKEMLLRANVLPPIEQLKILQGNSGLAVVVSAAQGVGYIYGILVRMVQSLHVAPIEAIGFYLSTIILIKASVHYFTSSCHRPLVLHLNEEKEGKFIDKCKELKDVPSARLAPINMNLWTIILDGGIIILQGGVLVFFVITIAKSTFFSIGIPLIILGFALFLIILLVVIMSYNSNSNFFEVWIAFLFFVIAITNLVGYIYSLVLTVKYWRSLGFNINTTGYLSYVLPYIG